MNWALVRREWGAVTFVLTVLIGLIVVPLALAFGHAGGGGSYQTIGVTPASSVSSASSAVP